MAPQSDHVIGHLKIASHLTVVGKLEVLKTSQEREESVSQALPKAAVQAPTWELRSDCVVLSVSPDENADGDDRALISDLDLHVGRERAPDSPLIPLALISAILVATVGWLWFLFQVGKWLLDY
jgi:hypothetical protein